MNATSKLIAEFDAKATEEFAKSERLMESGDTADAKYLEGYADALDWAVSKLQAVTPHPITPDTGEATR